MHSIKKRTKVSIKTNKTKTDEPWCYKSCPARNMGNITLSFKNNDTPYAIIGVANAQRVQKHILREIQSRNVDFRTRGRNLGQKLANLK